MPNLDKPVRAALPAPIKPPSLTKVLLETRVFFEAAKTALLWPFLRRPQLSGHGVLVLPGFCAGDASTWPLRAHLRQCGAQVSGWKLGVNRGPRGDVMDRLAERIRAQALAQGGPITLVGWSLGGVMARLVASRVPHAVDQVITLGSPLNGDTQATRLAGLYNAIGGRMTPRSAQTMLRESGRVPVTSIFSRSDGVVAWEAAAKARGQVTAIEVDSSHFGLVLNSAVLDAVAMQIAGSSSAALVATAA